MTAASHEKGSQADPVSKIDAPTQGVIDTMRRRQASPPETQREADIREAQEEGTWTPTEKEPQRRSNQATPRDFSGVNVHGVVDESMRPGPPD